MEEEFNIRPELESPIEEKIENSLRPQTLDEYIGQTKVKENMKKTYQTPCSRHLCLKMIVFHIFQAIMQVQKKKRTHLHLLTWIKVIDLDFRVINFD